MGKDISLFSVSLCTVKRCTFMQKNIKGSIGHIRKKFLLRSLVLCFLSFASTTSNGQNWKKISTPLSRFSEIAPYFLNENVGFIFAYNFGEVYRTTNGGIDWTLSTDSINCNQIYFISASEGYIASSNGILETKDTGNTWQYIYLLNQNCYSVYANDSNIFAIVDSGIKTELISTQRGKINWHSVITGNNGSLSSILGNKDSIVYAGMYDSSGNFNLWFSTDFGSSWGSNYQSSIPLSLYCTPQCHNLLKVHYPQQDNDTYIISLSDDYGKTWLPRMQQETGGWITGDGCIVYISNAGQAHSLYRSIDRGMTWNQIIGPDFTEIDDHDFHNLSVVGGGAVVYAVDIGGTMWKTINGGDGSLHSTPPASRIYVTHNSLDIINGNYQGVICDSMLAQFSFETVPCNPLHLESYSLDSLFPNEYSINYKTHLLCDGATDTFFLSMHPQVAGIRTIILKLHFVDDNFETYDTNFTFTLSFNPSHVASLWIQCPDLDTTTSPRSINFGTQRICSGGRREVIKLFNPSCKPLRIKDIRLLTDSLSTNDFSFSGNSPYNLDRRSSPNTFWVDYHPKTPGKKSGVVIIETDIETDTISLLGIVIADTAKLLIDKTDTINFGVKPVCIADGVDTIQISNPSCYGIQIYDVSFVSDSLTKQDYHLTTNGSLFLDDTRKPLTIIVRFQPLSGGIKAGKIIILSDLGSDTIEVYAEVTQEGRALGLRNDEITSPICDSIGTAIHVANFSCRSMKLYSISLPVPFHMLPYVFPVLLQTGDSIILPIRFAPLQRGNRTVTASASVGIEEPTGEIHFDTSFIVSSFATHGPFSYVLSAQSATFDTLHLCDSAKQRIVLYSIGCDSLPLSVISFSGDPDLQVTGIRGQASEIATGDSIVLNVSLNPTSIGNKSATITIALSDSSKVTIPITATIVRAVRILSSNASSVIDFGKQYTCDNSDTTITLRNPGCDTVRVSNIGFQGSGFGTNTSFPIIIPPGGSTTIDIQTILDTTGGAISNSARLTINSDADNTLPPVALTKSYIYPHPVHLWLDADAAPLTSSSVWKVKLKAMPNEVTDVRTIDLAISYSTDLLEYFSKPSGANTTNSSDGKSFTISGSPMIVTTADSIVAEFDFNVYLTKDTTTSLALGAIMLNSDPKFTSCFAIPQSAGIDFVYLNSCGDPSIRAFMKGLPLQLSIRPNPSQDEIELDLHSAMNQDALVEIFDALGAKVFSEVRNIGSGSNSLHLDTKSLSGGMYLVRVGGVSQSFMKVK